MLVPTSISSIDTDRINLNAQNFTQELTMMWLTLTLWDSSQ